MRERFRGAENNRFPSPPRKGLPARVWATFPGGWGRAVAGGDGCLLVCIYILSLTPEPLFLVKKLTRAPLPSLTLAKASSTFFAKLAVDEL